MLGEKLALRLSGSAGDRTSLAEEAKEEEEGLPRLYWARTPAESRTHSHIHRFRFPMIIGPLAAGTEKKKKKAEWRIPDRAPVSVVAAGDTSLEGENMAALLYDRGTSVKGAG
jgi:hypothetical protein